MIRSVAIPASKLDTDGHAFVLFSIVVTTQEGLAWVVRKRFNQLVAFRAEIKEHMKDSTVSFPSKIMVRGLQDRRSQLEAYLVEVVARGKIKKHSELRSMFNKFVELRQHIDASVLSTFTPAIAQRHLLTLLPDEAFTDPKAEETEEQHEERLAILGRQMLRPTSEVIGGIHSEVINMRSELLPFNQVFDGALLLADISGFTRLSELFRSRGLGKPVHLSSVPV